MFRTSECRKERQTVKNENQEDRGEILQNETGVSAGGVSSSGNPFDSGEPQDQNAGRKADVHPLTMRCRSSRGPHARVVYTTPEIADR
jgi:hypothetical protein